jgi:hypothetical protein
MGMDDSVDVREILLIVRLSPCFEGIITLLNPIPLVEASSRQVLLMEVVLSS